MRAAYRYERTLVAIFAVTLCSFLAAIPDASSAEAAETPSPANLSFRIVDIAESGSIGPITIENGEFSRTVRIETTAATESAVSIKANVDEDPSSGQATIVLDNIGEVVTLAPMKEKESRFVHIKALLPVPGKYRFSLSVIHADAPPLVYGIAVERTAPVVELVEAKGATLNLETDTSKYETQLVLRTTTRIPAEEVSVSVPALTGPAGKPVTTRIDEADHRAVVGTIDGLSTMPFKLSATLPESGKYSGTLDITFPGGRNTYALYIEKKLKAVTLDASVAATGTAMLCSEARLSLHLTLRETEGRTIHMQQPAITGLTRTVGSATTVAANYQNVAFFDNGELIKDWPVVLQPSIGYDLRLDISGITDPGHFAGKLLIPAVDHGAVDVPIAFKVKRHWSVAALMIFLGVVVSLIIRLWATQLRPRMQALKSILRSGKRLDDQRASVVGLRPEEKEIFDALHERLGVVYEDLRIGASSSAEPSLTMVDTKLNIVLKWVSFNRQLSDLNPPQIFLPLIDELNGVRTYLLNPSPADDDHAKAVATLNTLSSKINVAMENLLGTFLKNLEDLRRQLGDATLASDWQREVTDQVEAARSALAQDAFGGVSKKINQGRLGATRLLAQDLRSRLLAGGEEAPGWMSVHRFNRIGELLDEVETATSGEMAVKWYRQALKLYLEAYFLDIANRVQTLIADLTKYSKEEQVGAEAKKSIQVAINSLNEAKSKLDGIPGLIREGTLGEAVIIGREVEATYATYLSILSPPSEAREREKGAPPITRSAGAGDLPDLVLPVPAPSFPTTSEDTQGVFGKLMATTNVMDWLYHTLVVLVAVLLGVYVLWAENLTWGSATDILLAGLWGLGLHALSTGPTAYQGLADLAGKFR